MWWNKKLQKLQIFLFKLCLINRKPKRVKGNLSKGFMVCEK